MAKVSNGIAVTLKFSDGAEEPIDIAADGDVNISGANINMKGTINED